MSICQQIRKARGIALACEVFLLATSPASAGGPPTFALEWGGFGPGVGQFQHPEGVAVSNSGAVYVADGDRIQRFDRFGGFVLEWGNSGSGDGEFNETEGVAVTRGGGTDTVYVADTYNHRVQKFTGNGQFISKWGSYGTNPGEFDQPRGVAVDDSGYVYVVEWFGARVQKFTSDGTYTTQWGSLGSGVIQRVEWNGRDEAGHRMGSGVYFVRLTAGGHTQSHKLVITR